MIPGTNKKYCTQQCTTSNIEAGQCSQSTTCLCGRVFSNEVFTGDAVGGGVGVIGRAERCIVSISIREYRERNTCERPRGTFRTARHERKILKHRTHQ